MLGKTPSGVDFFDAEYGGLYRGRPMLLSGPSQSGKSLIGIQFVARGLKHQERCLLLSMQPSRDLLTRAESLGVPFSHAVESGSLILLEYSDFVPGRDSASTLVVPPEGFHQLRELIELEAITRVVIDPVLPWVTIPSAEHLAEHVFSFVRAFERMGVTALFTIPKPVSIAAVRLHRLLEEVVPISVLILHEAGSQKRTWLVNKYLGMESSRNEYEFEIRKEVLAVEVRRKSVMAEGMEVAGATLAPAPASAPVRKAAPPPPPSRGISIADAVLGEVPKTK